METKTAQVGGGEIPISPTTKTLTKYHLPVGMS